MSEPIVVSSASRRLAAAAACLVAMLAALAAVAPAQATSPGKPLWHDKPSHERPLSRADREFVDATIRAAMGEEGQPGISISISGPKGSYARSYGVSDIERQRPLRLEDHFHIGSVTKTFTATAILRQVDKGRLRLSDKLDRFVKGIPGGDAITVRDLLAMQSGLFEYQADPAFAEAVANPQLPFGVEDVLESSAATNRTSPPARAPRTRTRTTSCSA